MLAAGRDLVILVNDEELDRVQDRSLADGEIALVAGTNTDGELEVASTTSACGTSGTSASSGRKSINRSSTPEARPANTADAVVASETLNVRGGPGTNYPVLGALKKGDAVAVVGRSADSKWAKLGFADVKEAWASAQFLTFNIDFPGVEAAAAPPAPAAPPKQPPAAKKNVAWLVIENHIGRYITVQVNDKNFRVEGKVGNTPGRYQFELQGVGRYRVAAQLPNGGGHNWDLLRRADGRQVRRPPGLRGPRADVPADLLLDIKPQRPQPLGDGVADGCLSTRPHPPGPGVTSAPRGSIQAAVYAGANSSTPLQPPQHQLESSDPAMLAAVRGPPPRPPGPQLAAPRPSVRCRSACSIHAAARATRRRASRLPEQVHVLRRQVLRMLQHGLRVSHECRQSLFGLRRVPLFDGADALHPAPAHLP